MNITDLSCLHLNPARSASNPISAHYRNQVRSFLSYIFKYAYNDERFVGIRFNPFSVPKYSNYPKWVNSICFNSTPVDEQCTMVY